MRALYCSVLQLSGTGANRDCRIVCSNRRFAAQPLPIAKDLRHQSCGDALVAHLEAATDAGHACPTYRGGLRTGHDSPATVLRSWRLGCSEVATSRRGTCVLMVSRLENRHRAPARFPSTARIPGAFSFAPVAYMSPLSGGIRPSRSGRCRASTTVQIVRELQAATRPPVPLQPASASLDGESGRG